MMTLFPMTLFRPARFSRPSGLYLVKAVALVSLALLTISALPARAQSGNLDSQGGCWQYFPCDKDGNPLTSMISNPAGYETMNGPESGTITENYRALMNANFIPITAYNPYFGPAPDDWQAGFLYELGAPGEPRSTVSTASLYAQNTIGLPGYPGSAFAGNGKVWAQNPDGTNGHMVYLNGSVSSHVNGQLLSYYQVIYGFPYAAYYIMCGYGAYITPLTPPADNPMPDHLSLLLRTHVEASAGTGPGRATSGTVPANMSGSLSASATASDSVGETLTASIDGVNTFNDDPSAIEGHHLIRAPIDPLTGLATATLGGTLDAQASNGVSYDVTGYVSVNAFPSVSGATKPDNREMWISCPTVEPSYYKTGGDTGIVPPGTSVGQIGPYPATRTPHVRKANGAMVADSVATIDTGIVNGPMDWHSDVTYQANPINFMRGPADLWFYWSGTNFFGWDHDHNQVINKHHDFHANSVFGPVGTSAVAASVGDNDGAMATNTYSIVWHQPTENWQKDGDAHQVASVIYPDSGRSGGNHDNPVQQTTAQGQIAVTIPPAEVEIDYGPGVKVAGGVAVVGAEVLPLVGLTGPEGDIIAAILHLIGYTAGLMNVSPDPTTEYPTATSDAFTTSVQEQKGINEGFSAGLDSPTTMRLLTSSENADGSFTSTPADNNTLDAILANPHSYFSDNKVPMSATCVAGSTRMQQPCVADEYHIDGYFGPYHRNATYNGHRIYIWTWTLAPVRPMP